MRGPACAFFHGDSEVRLPEGICFDYLTLLAGEEVEKTCVQARPALVAASRAVGSKILENIDMEQYLRFAL
jgi:hypothetical protein